MKQFSVIENAWIARLAAKKLGSSHVAMVLGSRIYLHGVSKERFLSNERWLRHELKHIEQYEKLGFLGFIFRYIWQTARMGYQRCSLECEAREAETDETITRRFQLRQ